MNKIQTQIYIHYMFIVHPHKFTDRAKIKVEYVTCVLSRFHALQIFTNIQIYMFSVHFHTYILKAKKFAELPFKTKNIAEKVRVIFGPFWVIFRSFWVILGHSFLGHFGSYLCHFGSFLGHFVAFLDKFAESSNFLAG